MLASGTPQSFSLGPVSSATLFSGPRSYAVTVPQGATRLEIQLATDTPGADVDLFARFGSDLSVAGGRVVSDHSSTGPAGAEASPGALLEADAARRRPTASVSSVNCAINSASTAASIPAHGTSHKRGQGLPFPTLVRF